MNMSWGRTLLLYLYSRRNMAGCCLGLLGLAAFFGGWIDEGWLLITLGLYGAGALAVPSRSVIDADVFRQYDGQQLAAGVEALIKKSARQLPPEALALLQQIPPLLEPLLPHLTGANGAALLPAAQQHTLVSAITRELPQTVANYARLPPAFAALHPIAQGKTAKVLLIEQLTLLKNQLEKITTAVFADNADALVLHGQYLEQKFHAPRYDGF